MEFLFTDILILGLMVGALAWFRKSDRDNRSLEKVKRFSDKAVEDLAQISQQKAQELRDIAIEVDVHQQASKAALTRLHAVEEAIDTKNRDMEALRDRMDSYNAALLELVAMTQKAEENINRLRDESAYIDKVGRRLRSATSQLDQLEERLPRIVAEIQKQNKASLDELHQELTGNIGSELADIDGRLRETDQYAHEIVRSMRLEVDQARDDLAGHVEQYRQAFVAIEDEYRARLQETRDRAVGMQHEIMKGLEQELKVEREAIRAKSREGEEALARRLIELEDFAQGARAEVMETLKRIEIFADTKFSETASMAQEIIERKNAEHLDLVKNFSVAMESRHRSLAERASLDHDSLVERLEEERRTVRLELDNFADFVKESAQTLEGRYHEADEKNKAGMESFMATLRGRVEKIEQSLYKAEDDVATRLKAVHQQGLELAEKLMYRIDQDVETRTESLRGSMEKRIEDLGQWASSHHREIEQNFTDLRGRVDTWIGDSRSYMSTLDEQMKTLSAESLEANRTHKETIASHIGETKSRLDAYEQGLSSRVQNLEEYITRAEQLVSEEFRRLDALAQQLSDQNSQNIHQIFSQDRETMVEKQKEWIDGLRHELRDDQAKLTQELARQRQEVVEHLEELSMRLAQDRQASEEQVKDLETLQNRIGSEITQWRDSLNLLKAEQDRELSLTIKGLKEQAREEGTQLRDNFVGIRETLERTIDEEKRKIDQSFASLSVHATGLRTSLQQEMQAAIQGLQSKAQGLYENIQKELDLSFGDQEDKIRRLMESIEADIERLRVVSTESSGRIAEWDKSVRAADEKIRTDIETLAQQARQLARDENVKVKADFSTLLAETIQKMKSEMNHGRSDMEQDLVVLRKQMEQVRLDYQSQIKVMGEQAAELEDQAINGLKVRIEELRNETRDLTRKYQDDFSKAMDDIRAGLAKQNEAFRGDLKATQELGRDIQAQFGLVKEAADQQVASLRNLLDREKNGGDAMIASVREQFIRQVETMQRDLGDQLTITLTSLQSQIDGYKRSGEDVFLALNTQVQKWQADYTDRIKALVNEAMNMRKDSMAGIVERIDAVRDEARRMTGNVVEEVSKVLSEHRQLSEKQVRQTEEEAKRIEDIHAASKLRFNEIQDILNKAEATALKEFDSLKEKAQALAEQNRLGLEADYQRQREEFMGNFAQVLQNLARDAQRMRNEATQDLEARHAEQLAAIQKAGQGFVVEKQGFLDEVREALETARRDAQALTRDAQKIRTETQAELESKHAEQLAAIQKASQGFVEEKQTYLDEVREALETARRDTQALARDAQKIRSEVQADLEARHAEQLAAIQKASQGFVAEKQGFMQEVRTALDASREEAGNLADQTRQTLVQSQQSQAQLAGILSELRQDLEKRSLALAEEIASSARTMEQYIVQTTTEREQAAYLSVEKRIQEYEKGITYRLGKLEGVHGDIEELEQGLRMSMAGLSDRIKADLAGYGEEMRQQRRQDHEAAHKELEAIRLQMISVEREVDELKQRAYDNVSEKLKVFEDEFFVDLRNRSTRMQSQLEEWQVKVQDSMGRIEQNSERERERLEAQYSDLLKARLADVQDRLYGAMNRVESQFEAFNETLGSRMANAEKNLGGMESKLEEEVGSLQAKAQEYAQHQFGRVQSDLDQRLVVFQREVEQRMGAWLADAQDRRQEVDLLLEASRADVVQWQNQVLQQIKGMETQTAQDLAGLRSRSLETIEGIKEDFVRQRQELGAAGAEERNRIKRDIDEVQERLLRLSGEVDIKAREAIDSYNRQFSNFSQEMQRQNQELAGEVEERVRAFRAVVQETRAEFETMQKRLWSKLEDDSRILDANLKEMDKRLKAFQLNTKIFERADALKEDLEQKIALLHQEIESVETQRRDLLNLDPYVEKVRRLSEEVNDKFMRLQAEKKRLDSMDEDFRRLSGLSQMVDTKLNQVTAASDTLTQMQLALRQIEESQKSVDAKMERLEKKSRLAEATAESVDQNFQMLHDLEEKLKDIKDVFGELPARVADAQDKVGQLLSGKKDIDQALRGLGNVDKILKDVESRTAELAKSREWLARTETRMSEIYRDAQDQVNLLSTLVKQEVAQDRPDSASKSSSMQQNHKLVLQLANKGWKIEEIAKTTKLSRGEIELILELNNK